MRKFCFLWMLAVILTVGQANAQSSDIRQRKNALYAALNELTVLMASPLQTIHVAS